MKNFLVKEINSIVQMKNFICNWWTPLFRCYGSMSSMVQGMNYMVQRKIFKIQEMSSMVQRKIFKIQGMSSMVQRKIFKIQGMKYMFQMKNFMVKGMNSMV